MQYRVEHKIWLVALGASNGMTFSLFEINVRTIDRHRNSMARWR